MQQGKQSKAKQKEAGEIHQQASRRRSATATLELAKATTRRELNKNKAAACCVHLHSAAFFA
jgi:hypothetical protein